MKKRSSSIRELAIFGGVISVICTLLFLSGDVSALVYEALIDTIRRVVPALFPFMVCSRFIVESGSVRLVEDTVGRLLASAFNVSREVTGAIFIGAISSYPVGAMAICSLVESGKISRKEAERGVFLAHNTGPAFPIGVIGIQLWGSAVFGLALYASQMLSSFMMGLLLRGAGESASAAPAVRRASNRPISSVLTEAISTSAVACIGIVGFVVFWETVVGMIDLLFDSRLELVKCILASFLEFSAGVLNASALGGVKGAALCGFAIGFGGVSAIMQASVCTIKHGIAMKRFVWLKVLQGVISAIFAIISYNLIFG